MSAGLILSVIGLALLVIAELIRRRSGLPAGAPVYIDTGKLETAAPLFDPEWGLAGRPDYILKHRRAVIPVEVKTGSTPPQPYEGHTLQLAAYLKLVEAWSGYKPGYGYIVYPQSSFRVANTRSLERRLQETLARMRISTASLPPRSHTNTERCSACGFRSACDQALRS